MKKMINKSNIEGLLYETTLEEREAGPNARQPGAKYISGNLSIQITEDNIVDVRIFENEITRAGKKNQKYDTLSSLINGNSVVSVGKDDAVAISVNSALSLNDWHRPDGTLLSTVQNENGFINLISKGSMDPKATFETDMLIASTRDEMAKSADGTMEASGALVVKGYIFDFADRILPVEFTVENEDGAEYFRDMEPNTFTKVWGKQVTTTETVQQTEKSAFGADKVVEFTNTKKKMVITGTNVEPYMFGEEGILTVQEVQDAIAARNVYLADQKSRSSQQATVKAEPKVVTDPTTATFTF